MSQLPESSHEYAKSTSYWYPNASEMHIMSGDLVVSPGADTSCDGRKAKRSRLNLRNVSRRQSGGAGSDGVR